MNFNKHLDLEGKHAELSPSKYTWVYKTREELIDMHNNAYAQAIGTVLHEFAMKRIKWRMSLRKMDSDAALFYLLDHGIPYSAIDMDRIFPNLRSYTNDSIAYHMTPEVTLAPEGLHHCFGTADAIEYDHDGLLRIHDLKTGVGRPFMDQLLIYAALFFLEYPKCKLEDSEVELRIYHCDEVITDRPEKGKVREIMNCVVNADSVIEQYVMGV